MLSLLEYITRTLFKPVAVLFVLVTILLCNRSAFCTCRDSFCLLNRLVFTARLLFGFKLSSWSFCKLCFSHREAVRGCLSLTLSRFLLTLSLYFASQCTHSLTHYLYLAAVRVLSLSLSLSCENVHNSHTFITSEKGEVVQPYQSRPPSRKFRR